VQTAGFGGGRGAGCLVQWRCTHLDIIRSIFMDESKALTIVSALANGVNPLTGEIFTTDSPYQSPDIVRALYISVRALEFSAKRRLRARERLPGNAGKPWSEEEDHRLLSEFDRGCAVAELAQAHQRTQAGIQARLEKHGRLQSAAATTFYRRPYQATAREALTRAEVS
jgi:hypothetical protein